MNFNKSVRWLTTVAMLSAVSFTGRIAFQFIPNIQPLTTIIIICTLVFGFTFGSTVSILSMLISNLFLGMGIWTVAQIGAYLAVTAVTYLLAKPLSQRSLVVKACFSGIMGFFYGLIISLIQAPFFGIQTFSIYYLQGLPFDGLHAIGNFGFFLILYPILVPLLKKIRLN